VIPQDFITEWKKHAPWPERYQVEQDLVISRALVEMFTNSAVMEGLAFRGGTALFKLHLKPLRYSEDIDLVQVNSGPIGPLMDAIQEQLNPWLGVPRRSRSEGRVTLLYRSQAEEGAPLKLKIEINSREHFSVLGYEKMNFCVDSRWFSGSASILTYHLNELLGTKVRALYQRKKGRDLFDLWKALTVADVQSEGVIKCFLYYVEQEEHKVSRAEFEENLLLKLEDPRFLDDIGPLLAPDCACDMDSAADCVLNRLAVLIPGEPWEGRGEKRKRRKDEEAGEG
jgi:predicted nucleotidyltransferase component of viral defense system